MHWVLIEAIYDVVVPKMDPYCIAGIKGRGPHSAAKQVARWMKTDRAGMKYGARAGHTPLLPRKRPRFYRVRL